MSHLKFLALMLGTAVLTTTAAGISDVAGEAVIADAGRLAVLEGLEINAARGSIGTGLKDLGISAGEQTTESIAQAEVPVALPTEAPVVEEKQEEAKPEEKKAAEAEEKKEEKPAEEAVAEEQAEPVFFDAPAAEEVVADYVPEESYEQEVWEAPQEYYEEESYAYEPEQDYDAEETYDAGDYVEEEPYVEETYYEESSETTQRLQASASDLDLLAAIIQCEAGGESYEGKVAVGAVVLNRMESSLYPDSMTDVVYQSGQFTPAMTGSLDSVLASGATEACYEAAEAALAGENPVGDRLYFHAGGGEGLTIGNQTFY